MRRSVVPTGNALPEANTRRLGTVSVPGYAAEPWGHGGGYGEPKKRDAGLVAAEVRNGVISAEAARDVYGVVVTGEDCAVDEAATVALREE